MNGEPDPFADVRLMEARELAAQTSIVDTGRDILVGATIRAARPEDDAQLEDIGRAYLSSDGEDYLVFVLVTPTTMGDRVEGALSVRPSSFNGAKSLSVEGIDSAPQNMHNARDRMYGGVGSRLMQFAVHASRELGCEGRIHLSSRNPGSDAFYESLSFNDEGLRRDKDGRFYLPKKLAPKFTSHIERRIQARA